MRRGCLLLATALLVVTSVTARAHEAAKPWEKQGVSEEVFWSVLETLYGEEAEAVCITDEVATKMDLRGGRLGKLTTMHVQIAVLDARAAQEYASVEIPYVKSWDKITELSARTMASDGTELEVRNDQIYDVDFFPEYVLYSDLKAKRFTFPAFTDHCVVDYRCSIYSEAPFVWMTFFFQQLIPTQVSRCRIEVPIKLLNPLFRGTGWGQVYSTRNFEGKPKLERLTTIDGEVATYTWELEDVPAAKLEKYAPAREDICPSVSFAPGTSFTGEELTWETFGNWFYQAMEDRLEPDDAMKMKVRSLTEGMVSDHERIESIFDYLRNEVRYVAVEFDEGMWFPSGARLTNKAKYGDCKDQSALLTAMLREAGINAEMTLVRTRDRGRLNRAIISPIGFNHCIVHATGQSLELWLDPTAKHHGLGYCRGRFRVWMRSC
jgi:hypothetical protein